MAILQYYRKVRETEEEVEYEFGFPEKDRLMTFTKRTREHQVTDERLDHASGATARGILRRLVAEGTWPTGGVVQH